MATKWWKWKKWCIWLQATIYLCRGGEVLSHLIGQWDQSVSGLLLTRIIQTRTTCIKQQPLHSTNGQTPAYPEHTNASSCRYLMLIQIQLPTMLVILSLQEYCHLFVLHSMLKRPWKTNELTRQNNAGGDAFKDAAQSIPRTHVGSTAAHTLLHQQLHGLHTITPSISTHWEKLKMKRLWDKERWTGERSTFLHLKKWKALFAHKISKHDSIEDNLTSKSAVFFSVGFGMSSSYSGKYNKLDRFQILGGWNRKWTYSSHNQYISFCT